MNKKTITKIYLKYITILKWLEDNEYCEKDYSRNSDALLKDFKKGLLHIDCFKLNFIRGNHYIEMGSPSKEDIEVFQISTDFKFNIKGDESVMKKWHYFISTLEDDLGDLPKELKDCYFDTFYEDNKVKISFDNYYSWTKYSINEYPEQSNKPLNFCIPITITYNVGKVKMSLK